MIQEHFHTAAPPDLIAAYTKAAGAYGVALQTGNHRVANTQHSLLTSIYREIKARGPDIQRMLMNYLSDPDVGIRTCAATHALDFSPVVGEKALEAIARDGGVLGLTASIVLREWKNGKLCFT